MKKSRSKNNSRLIILYAIFAFLAIIVNFFGQIVFLYVYSGSYSLYLSIIFGTGLGFIFRYFLDKSFIFKFKTSTLKKEIKTMIFYAFISIFSTIIFWGFELFFYFVFHFLYAKFVGGSIGLIIAFTAKYFLDKKYVFIK